MTSASSRTPQPRRWSGIQSLETAAAWLLGILGMTDWVDGFLARRLNQVSDVGKVLDPVADRLALIVGIGCILIDGSAPVWVAVAVLVREVTVAVAGITLGALGACRIDVTTLVDCRRSSAALSRA